MLTLAIFGAFLFPALALMCPFADKPLGEEYDDEQA
jgi:hypothetical protein